jgi:hypothetical protein
LECQWVAFLGICWVKHPILGLGIGRESGGAGFGPDLIKDEEVLATPLVKEPIRFVKSEREGREWCGVERGWRFDQRIELVESQFLELLE